MSDCLYVCVYTNTGMYACARTYAPVCVSGGVCVSMYNVHVTLYMCMTVCTCRYATCIIQHVFGATYSIRPITQQII